MYAMTNTRIIYLIEFEIGYLQVNLQLPFVFTKHKNTILLKTSLVSYNLFLHRRQAIY